MHTYKELYYLIEENLKQLDYPYQPRNLYEPINYMLSLGGKRLRPVLVLLSNEMFAGNVQNAIPAALSVEMFHNFSLVHDDIMDAASIRRGMPTVHKKWDETVAILSGDLMMIKAIDLLCETEDTDLKTLIACFNKAATEVCEGQQIDMNFEKMGHVTSEQYIQMITLKTAVLLGASLQLGAIIAGASIQDQLHVYEFGKQIGIAFQIQDDILDAFGHSDKIGKKIGGDIVANKKTILMIEARKRADESQLLQLDELLLMNDDLEKKINGVLDIFRQTKVLEICEEMKLLHFSNALKQLENINVSSDRKIHLKESALELMQRIR
jgi:geranylgeranyl diphosphate synthase type II